MEQLRDEADRAGGAAGCFGTMPLPAMQVCSANRCDKRGGRGVAEAGACEQVRATVLLVSVVTVAVPVGAPVLAGVSRAVAMPSAAAR
jgi:hypothetical protein